MPLRYGLRFPLGGDPIPEQSILPASRKFGRGLRFANVRGPIQSAYVGFNGVTVSTVNGVVARPQSPSDRSSLSGVIGNRFKNARPLSPVSVCVSEKRFTFKVN